MTKQERFLATAASIANVVLVVGGVASALFFVYVCYRSGGDVLGRLATWKGVLGVVGPALLAGLLFAALRLKREYKVDLMVVCVVLVLSVYVGEVIMRLFVLEPGALGRQEPVMVALQKSENKQREAARLEKEYSVAIDARDKSQVITDLRSKGIDAVPSVVAIYQLRFHYDRSTGGSTNPPPLIALGGIANKLTVLCNESGQFVTYESDEHGFRNPKGLWQQLSPDIMTLGDSFTQGYCVPSGKSFVDIIRRRHPATVNLGMAGEGPLLMLSTLKEYGRFLRPKRVLWFYFEGNDFLDLEDERKDPLVVKYLNDDFSQRLFHRQDEIDRVLADLVEREKARDIATREQRRRVREQLVPRILDIVKLRAVRLKFGMLQRTTGLDTTSASHTKDVDLLHQILSRAKATVASWSGTLHFVYLPSYQRFMQRPDRFFYRPLSEEHQHDDVLKVARNLEIPIIDVLPAFKAQADPLSFFPFRAPGHYTESGHGLVAEEVLKAIGTGTSPTAARDR